MSENFGFEKLNSFLPAESFEYDYAGLLGSWRQINDDGFGTINNFDSRCMAIYGGDLYVAAVNWTDGAQVWKYHNGTWTQVNTNGFGHPGDGAGNGICQVNSLVVYRGYLYAATYGDVLTGEGGFVFRYDGGTSWTQVNASGFGNPNNYDVTCMVAIDGKLYAGTDNVNEGCEVWVYDGAAITPSWTRIGNGGLGDPNQILVTNILPYRGEIYIGTGVLAGHGGCGVFKYEGGSTWTQVNTEGFGDNNNYDSWSLGTFLDYLLVGTYNPPTGCELWRYDGSTWIQVGSGGMAYDNALILDGLVTLGDRCFLSIDDWSGSVGARLLISFDADNWIQVQAPGLGDLNNNGYYGLLADKHDLYISTFNLITGCEVWKYQSRYSPEGNFNYQKVS